MAAVDLHDVRALVTVPDEEMLPPPGLFLHRSWLHGPAHVGRVMIHALRLVEATGLADATPPLWAAVYLHDIARTHDGWESEHGPNACARLARLTEVRALLVRGGVREADWPAIETAVARHSRGEAASGEPYQQLIELLKDADGLDRVRLGDLDPAYLRNPQARAMVPFAEQLLRATDPWRPPSADHFGYLWREAWRLLQPAAGVAKRRADGPGAG